MHRLSDAGSIATSASDAWSDGDREHDGTRARPPVPRIMADAHMTIAP
jgi:hypothetical protein